MSDKKILIGVSAVCGKAECDMDAEWLATPVRYTCVQMTSPSTPSAVLRFVLIYTARRGGLKNIARGLYNHLCKGKGTLVRKAPG